MKHFRRGFGMNVDLIGKCPDHHIILCQMRQYAQFNLGIVGIQQGSAGTCHEDFAQSSPFIRSHRDILNIRLGGRKPSRGCNVLPKRGMHPAVVVNRSQQAVHIRRLQFLHLAVLQYIGYDLVTVLQGFQHFHIGGIPGLGSFDHRQIQFIKQDFPQLLG